MTWIPQDHEIASVLLLDGPKRYEYFVKKVADQQQLWSLQKENGWALVSDEVGHQIVPVWPHEKYAEICANGTWKDYQPKSIDVDVWLDRWIPGMEKDGRLVAIFQTPQDKGLVVNPKRVEGDLREELSQYE